MRASFLWRESSTNMGCESLSFGETHQQESGPVRIELGQKSFRFWKKFGRPVARALAADSPPSRRGFFRRVLPRSFRSDAMDVERSRDPWPCSAVMLHGWLRAATFTGELRSGGEGACALDLANRVAKTNLPGQRHVRRRAGKLFGSSNGGWGNGVLEEWSLG